MGKHWRMTMVVGLVAGALMVVQAPAAAAPVRGAGHVDVAWTVTDAAGSPPPDTFGPQGGGRWAGADRIWNQPGFTGSYRITFDGAVVFGYCGDFHNAKSPDAASVWVADRSAFAGSDKALTKLSYAQWRWGATTDPDIGAAMNLYTHFLGSPGDRSNSNGVPVPDINDNDILDEVVTTLAPHANVATIMSAIDVQAESWSAAFGHQPAHVEAGVEIEVVAGTPVVTATATGHPLPSGTYDLSTAGRQVKAVTASVAQPLRDTTAGSQNSITAGVPQTAQVDIAPNIVVTSQIADDSPALESTLTDGITITGLWEGETATVRVELFDLNVDPAGAATPLATETRAELVDGTTSGWASFDLTPATAGHRLGYRHRLEAIVPAPANGVLPGDWSELGIASETAMVDDVRAAVHLRKTVSSSSHPAWVNAQQGTASSHAPASAPMLAADGSHDDHDPDVGDAVPVFVEGDAVSFRYEVWLDETSTADVAWPAASSNLPTGVVIDDAGTDAGEDPDADDFSPAYVGGDDGDGRLSTGETWVFEARDQREARAGERYTNVASVRPGAMLNPVTGEPTDRSTAARVDPAGYTVPCLSTSVSDLVDGDRTLHPEGGTVVDEASFCNLVPGEHYVINGVVVVQSTGEPTEFRGSTTFVPDAPNGTVDVEIQVGRPSTVPAEIESADGETGPAPSLAAGGYVVFETVTLAASGEVVAVHADLDDAAQTFAVAPRMEATPPEPPTPTGPPAQPEPSTPLDPPAPPAVPVPPAVANPPTIPKVGSGAAHLATLIALALFTAGVVLMELRHGRIAARHGLRRGRSRRRRCL